MEKRVIDLEKGILKLYKIYEIEKKKNFQLENDFILLKRKFFYLNIVIKWGKCIIIYRIRKRNSEN